MIKPSKGLLNLDNAACTDFPMMTVNGWLHQTERGQRNYFAIVLISLSFYLDVISWSLLRKHNLFPWSSLFRTTTGEGIYPWDRHYVPSLWAICFCLCCWGVQQSSWMGAYLAWTLKTVGGQGREKSVHARDIRKASREVNTSMGGKHAGFSWQDTGASFRDN